MMTTATRIGLFVLIVAAIASDSDVVARCKCRRRRNCCAAQSIPADKRANCCNGVQVAKVEGREGKLELNLRGIPEKGRLAVELEVVNVGRVPIAWDRDCATFVYWRVFMSDGTEANRIPMEVVKDADRDASARFTVLRPGERFKKRVVLSEAVRCFATGSAMTDEGDVPIAYEEIVRFDVPNDAREVRVVAQYECVSGMALGSFRVYFGVEAIDTGFPPAFVQKEAVVRLEGRDEKKFD
jgi:hypothetical protein